MKILTESELKELNFIKYENHYELGFYGVFDFILVYDGRDLSLEFWEDLYTEHAHLSIPIKLLDPYNISVERVRKIYEALRSYEPPETA